MVRSIGGVMNDARKSLEAQVAHVAENLRLIAERKSEYVEATSIPLDLVKRERELLVEQEELRRRLAQLAADTECPYRSLDPFDNAHAAYFFGRDDLIAALMNSASSGWAKMLRMRSGGGLISVIKGLFEPLLGVCSRGALRDGLCRGHHAAHPSWQGQLVCPSIANPGILCKEPGCGWMTYDSGHFATGEAR